MRAGDSGLNLLSAVAANWYVSDRWAANLSLQHARSYFDRRLAGGYWSTSASAGIAYFIEDRTSLSLSVSEAQQQTSGPAYLSSGSRAYRRDGRFALGITYGFSGGLDAPGLIEPVRPLN